MPVYTDMTVLEPLPSATPPPLSRSSLSVSLFLHMNALFCFKLTHNSNLAKEARAAAGFLLMSLSFACVHLPQVDLRVNSTHSAHRGVLIRFNTVKIMKNPPDK